MDQARGIGAGGAGGEAGGDAPTVAVLNPRGRGPVVLACEHASAFIPDEFDGLGLSEEARVSHIAWDPGALAVAQEMSRLLDAPLVAQQASRLLYDCNRPPESPTAIPARVERFEAPGNAALTEAQRAERVRRFYEPFRDALAGALDARAGTPTALVTVHSFTPVWMGVPRAVRLGVLHDADSRLADALLAACAEAGDAGAERNAPYGPQDGVTHTLVHHALPRGMLNAMIEIRNDLIADAAAQRAMAARLSDRIRAALARTAKAAPDA